MVALDSPALFAARVCFPYKNTVHLEESVQHRLKGSSTLLRILLPKQGEEVTFYRVNRGLALFCRLGLFLDLCCSLPSLSLSLLLHAGEGIFDVDNPLNLADESLGLQLVARPAGREILELNNPLQDFSSLPQRRLTSLIQPSEDRPHNLVLVDVLTVVSNSLIQVAPQPVGNARTLEE